jgi:hypothetical protein
MDQMQQAALKCTISLVIEVSIKPKMKLGNWVSKDALEEI